MKTFAFLFVMALCVLVLPAFLTVNSPRCVGFAIDDTFNQYIAIGYRDNNAIDVSYEPDVTGGDVATTLELHFCQSESTTACQLFEFDSTADGLGNTHTLVGGGAIELAGVRGITGFNFLRVVQAGADPSIAGATPVLTVCRRAV